MYELIRYLLPAGFGWACAQIPKFLICKIRKKPVDIFASGGMPSTHTASVVAVVTRIAFAEGFHGTLFALGAVFAIVTAFDACNVRLQCGRIAEKMNVLIDKVYDEKDPEKPEKFKVIKGHTLLEVLVGVVIGLLVGAAYAWIEGKILG